MIPAKLWVDDIANELGLGLDTLLGSSYSVHPIMAAYTPGPTLTRADITILTGITAKNSNGPPDIGIDPVTGLWKINVPFPTGGYDFSYNGMTPAPPAHVYGFALTNLAHTQLFAVTPRLNVPITLTVACIFVLGEFSGLVQVDVVR